MELTIEQALQQGVAAQKEGRLQDAERLYRAILQLRPGHPDANHNLGVLVVSVNKADAALPLFKNALEANPNIEQFWLSYIDALIKEQQFDNAKQVLEQAKKQGVHGDRLNSLEAHLSSRIGTTNTIRLNPPRELFNSLLGYYQNGRFAEAEKLSVEITQDFPKDPFAWKILGAVLAATGRNSEAVYANQAAATLSPEDPEVHYNLGVTLKELGRLGEAFASYNQAISFKPDFAEAHSNLGNTLQELGRLEEAEASYNQAIAFKPDYADAHYNLGNTLRELGRLGEAVASYNQAIAFNPDFANAHNNLGITLSELGRLEEAVASYNQAIAFKPDFTVAHYNLGNALRELGGLEAAEVSYTKAMALKPDYVEALHNLSMVQGYMHHLEGEIVSLNKILQMDADNYDLRAGVNLAVCKFLEGDFVDSKKYLLMTTKIQNKTLPMFKNEKIYHEYLSKILEWRENKYPGVKKLKNDKDLYVIGESHSLTSHHLRIQNSGTDFFCNARLIKGCKQWHLGNAFRNQYKHQFESIFFALPKKSHILLAIGEIDCRLDTGIIAHKRKFPEKPIKKIIVNTVVNYLNYIVNNNLNYQHNILIQGVPCPNLDIREHAQKDIEQLVEVIDIFNYELKIQSKELGFRFVDTHQLTNKGDGMSSGFWHLDYTHLSPEGMLEAWRKYTCH